MMTYALVTTDKVEEDSREFMDEAGAEDAGAGVESPAPDVAKLVAKETEGSFPVKATAPTAKPWESTQGTAKVVKVEDKTIDETKDAASSEELEPVSEQVNGKVVKGNFQDETPMEAAVVATAKRPLEKQEVPAAKKTTVTGPSTSY